MRNNKIRQFSFIFISLLFIFIFNRSVDAKFINTWYFRIGGGKLVPGEEYFLAKFDIVTLNKAHYDDIGGDSWGLIKDINPNSEIYLYTVMVNVNASQDNFPAISLNSLGRYNVSRGHSMGNLNRDNPSFFLKDAGGARITKKNNSQLYMLDFGNSSFQNYSIEATIDDHVNQPWTADGVYSDNCVTKIRGDMNAVPVKYDTDTKWSNAMQSMINAMTAGLHSVGQKFFCNRGLTRTEQGYNSWLALDNSSNPPDIVADEIVFATKAGSGDIQFYSELPWKRQVDLLGLIKNSKVFFQSSTDLAPGESGTDNYGNSFTFWEAFWFALGSYLVGKNDTYDNSYFEFIYSDNYSPSEIPYFEEYDKIDLGKAISSYHISNINGNNIYWREFDDGYVYVNPTKNDVTSIPLEESCKQRTHDNLGKDLRTLQNTDTLNLKSHRAAILYKGNKLASLNAPNNFRIIVK